MSAFCLAIVAVGPSAAAESPPAGSPAARGTAHDPQFDDRELWPHLTGKEYFLKENWPKARLMVWAHPGQGGGRRARGGLDVTDPKNWLVDGRPADEVVLDENTDLLLPASDTPYSLGFRDTEIREVCRHLTIEPGAGFIGGGDGRGRTIYGNVWVKQGGSMYAQGATNLVGSRHTFFRNDNVEPNPRGERKGDLHRCSQYFAFNKQDGASVEFLGHVTVSDEFRLHGGLVIVGRDSQLQPGRHASPTIYQNGTLALLDGAYFGSWCNDFGIPEMTVEGGTIQGGLPDRPLSRSCTFGLAFKNFTNATCPVLNEEEHEESRRVPSLVVLPGSTLRSYSTDPSRARLVFTYMPDGIGEKTSFDLRPMPGSEAEQRALERSPEAAERFKWFDALPRGLDCFLGRDVTIDGVEFDHLRRGGIMCPDPAARAGWKDLFFGPHCQGSPAEMQSPLAGLGRGGDY